MKNNYKIFIIILLNFLLLIFKTQSEEIKFKANEVLSLEEGNIIVGKDKAEAIIDGKIEIYADKVTYNKKNEILIAEGNVLAIDLLNEIKINSKKINYDKINNQILSIGKTFFYIKNNYEIETIDVSYKINEEEIFSNEISSVKDKIGNKINLKSFKYFNKTQTLNGNEIEILDKEEHKYFLSAGIIRLKNYELLGKDIKVLLKNDIYGNPKNEPKLVGNSVHYYEDKTVVKKGIFTSCGENNNCPPWSITSKEITHFKQKKEIHYKNAWLRLYNTPVFYFPKFFHPDPSVGRKSGFLIPSFGNSKNLGGSVNVPYFHVISESADLTFKPRFFSTTEYLLQSEYRKETKNSSHIADFSLNKDDDKDGSKTHFFSNSIINLKPNFFEKSEINLKLEKVSNDDYTRLYSLESTSPIIKDTNILENVFEFSGSRDDLDFILSFESYETMNKLNSDKYEFIYPNYSLNKAINLNNDFIDSLDFSSSGNQKKFSTNIYEAIQVNDIVLNSNKFINKLGFSNKIRSIIKNVNSDSNNSTKLKEKKQSEILGLVAYDLDLPLIKEKNDNLNLLTPRLSLRYSPSDNKNLKNEDRLLSSDNIFSLDRIGFNDELEGGKSLTLGLDYEKKNQKNGQLFDAKLATVFRDELNENLPTTSTLGKKQSDFVGEIRYLPNSKFLFDYNFSIDNDLDQMNFHSLENSFTVNNFVNTFTFYEENNQVGSKSYYENTLSYMINENNSFSFKTRENKTDNLTEYYNLIYEYKNDCLTASITYNKDYYSSGNIKPSEELFFNITLIPLGSTKTGSILE